MQNNAHRSLPKKLLSLRTYFTKQHNIAMTLQLHAL